MWLSPQASHSLRDCRTPVDHSLHLRYGSHFVMLLVPLQVCPLGFTPRPTVRRTRTIRSWKRLFDVSQPATPQPGSPSYPGSSTPCPAMLPVCPRLSVLWVISLIPHPGEQHRSSLCVRPKLQFTRYGERPVLSFSAPLTAIGLLHPTTCQVRKCASQPKISCSLLTPRNSLLAI